jgi:hemerythrin-like metal-binding protein
MSLPEKLIWNTSYSIGNTTIDNEHMQMLQVYNELIDLIKNNEKDRRTFASILSKLTDFSLYHFKNEEKYMLNMKYPDIEEHKELHKEYIYQVALFNTELLGPNPPKPTEIINFVKNWLDNHIFKEDIKYVNFNKENNLNAKY